MGNAWFGIYSRDDAFTRKTKNDAFEVSLRVLETHEDTVVIQLDTNLANNLAALQRII